MAETNNHCAAIMRRKVLTVWAHLCIIAAAHGRQGLREVCSVQVEDCVASAEVADHGRERHCRSGVANDHDAGTVSVVELRLHSEDVFSIQIAHGLEDEGARPGA